MDPRLGTTGLDSVKRWSKDMKKNVDTQLPHLCAAYVQGMGGVDALDQVINVYRIGIRSKKWWWVLFTHMLNNCMVNAWRLYLLANFFCLFAIFILYSRESDVSLCFGR